ncbi:hypothetical protein Tco_1401215 [Tanacetum coccineum]
MYGAWYCGGKGLLVGSLEGNPSVVSGGVLRGCCALLSSVVTFSWQMQVLRVLCIVIGFDTRASGESMRVSPSSMNSQDSGVFLLWSGCVYMGGAGGSVALELMEFP